MSVAWAHRTMTFTTVSTDAVNTIEWLSTKSTTLVVPVYQRHYRWEIDACERLLADIRAVASGDAGQTHFFGSILFTPTSSEEITERMLVHSQQRVATLILLLTAIRDTLADSDGAISQGLRRGMLHPTSTERTRVRLHKEGAEVRRASRGLHRGCPEPRPDGADHLGPGCARILEGLSGPIPQQIGALKYLIQGALQL